MPGRRQISDEDLQLMRLFREDGMSYPDIAREFNVAYPVVRYWLTPDRDNQIRACKRYRDKYYDDPRLRAKKCVAQCRRMAKRKGYAPCNTDVGVIAAAFTGRCFICGVPEAECSRRLHMEHDHKTGEFRGWACNRCNVLLGHADNAPEVFERIFTLTKSRDSHACHLV